MLRVPFTAEDVARTRFAPSPAPMLELTAAVAMLQRHDPLFALWRRRAARALPRSATPLLELVPANLAGPLFLDPVSQGFDDGLDIALSTPTPVVQAELRRVFGGRPRAGSWLRALSDRDTAAWQRLRGALESGYDILLGADWSRIRACYQAELELKGRQWACDGAGAVLTSIHPGSHWDGSALNIPVESRLLIDLGGRGVTLMPSVFWRGRPMFTWHPDGSLVIVYPAATPLPLAATGAGSSAGANASSHSSVGALLGSTRAGVLAAAASASTTTELARAAGVSLASASEHATILRNAGLITSRRQGRQVSHAITWLGQQLLHGDGGAPATRITADPARP
jgi:DNA-binding transcriptional ArsR family regulator